MNKVILFVLLILSLVGATFWFYKSFLVRGFFPQIPAGAYVGTITYPDTKKVSIYFERFKGSDTALFVAFEEGFVPLTVPLSLAVGNEGYQPLDLPLKNSKYRVTGEMEGEVFSGVIESISGQRGLWELKPFPRVGLERPAEKTPLLQWLVVKDRYREALLGMEDSERALVDSKSKREMLQAYLTDDKKLESKAKERREQLALELQKLIEERKKSVSEVSLLADRLNTFRRVTNKGRAVELARRISHRENKWLDAQWETNAETLNLAESLGVDAKQLEVELEKAKDVSVLLDQIKDEESKIRELEGRIRGQNSTVNQNGGNSAQPTVAPDSVQPQPQPSEGNLWDRIFN